MNEYEFDMGQDLSVTCEASGCSAKATDKIAVKVGTLGVISLILCNDCVSKFLETTQT